MCRDAKQQERLRAAEDSGQELTQASSGNWVYLMWVVESRKEKTSDPSLNKCSNSSEQWALSLVFPRDQTAVLQTPMLQQRRGSLGPGSEVGALTFEGFIDVAAEVVDPVGIVECRVTSSRHPILCDINWRVVVFFLQPV